MAVRRIDLRWGDGFESIDDRERARPLLRAATELALGGLEYFGIELERPRRMVVHNAEHTTRLGRTAGGATAPGTFHVSVRPNQDTRKLQTQIEYLAATSLHELTHCIRLEQYSSDNLFELAATEGLAYNLERQFRYWANPSSRAKGLVARIGGLDAEKIDPLRATFVRLFADVKQWDYESCAEWYEAEYYERLGKAEVIGVRTVKERVDAGQTIASLLMQPARRVLAA